jgi:hypothetical protein
MTSAVISGGGAMDDMTNRDRPTTGPVTTRAGLHEGGGHGAHHVLMMLMCAPMVLIVVLLVASGTSTAGALLIPLMCMAMMAVMMGYMMPKDR